MRRKCWWALTLLLIINPCSRSEDLGEEGFVDSQGVRIHYVTLGKGPLIVLIHGFPDFWYSWRDQMPGLAKHFQVVAIDQRGYNKSDQPKGVESYRVDKLVEDVDAVLKHFKQDKTVIVGHVKFGGSPTDISNKVYLPRSVHSDYTRFWNALQRSLENR